MSLRDQLEAFARERGGVVRFGPQPPRPPSIGPSEKPKDPLPAKPLADPMIDYTDDYSLWCRVKRGE